MLQFRAIRSVVRLFPDLLNELIGGNKLPKDRLSRIFRCYRFIKLVLTQVQLKGYF